MSWYKREPIAFLDGVQGMGPELIGTYAVILDLLYARGGSMRRDDRHLSGVLGCSIRKAEALTDAVIATGKIACRDGFITNSRVETVLAAAWDARETKLAAARKGGEKSGETRKNKVLAEANALPEGEQKKEEEREEEKKVVVVAARAGAPAPVPDHQGTAEHPPTPLASGAPDFYTRLLHAVGHTAGPMPTRWLPPHGEMHAHRWLRDLGITEDEAIAVATASRARFPTPPDGPKALDRAMQAFAAEKAAAPLAPLQSGTNHMNSNNNQPAETAMQRIARLRAEGRIKAV